MYLLHVYMFVSIRGVVHNNFPGLVVFYEGGEGGCIIILLYPLYNTICPPHDCFPHAFIVSPSKNCATSAIPPPWPDAVIFCLHQYPPLVTFPTLKIFLLMPSSPLLPFSLTNLSEFPSLYFRCPHYPTDPPTLLPAAISARFPCLPYPLSRISVTDVVVILPCLF